MLWWHRVPDLRNFMPRLFVSATNCSIMGMTQYATTRPCLFQYFPFLYTFSVCILCNCDLSFQIHWRWCWKLIYGRHAQQDADICIFVLFLSSSFFPCQRLEIECLPYFHTGCSLNANLECRSEMCCTRLTENTGRKNDAKKSPSRHAPSHNVGLYLCN